ncbi:hypothetical protein B7R56_21090 [Pseudomonas savastanoi pv. retacarpa]|uniref:Uncharacterized protein n=2 Tax=Pseudomonas savastanoi TaxID=29438 RepID=A0A0P9VJW0_PSESS|nr:hypothetical protein PSA3335_09290 [Pseudomonas savastanoi pv. savastanoi NCPPB 3335]KAA3536194.1 hypothetical protein DXU85_23660 [Pseudomonas savastanoi]KPW63864.1 hypothetical protein ALO78_100820 [Pseudomonas amygdali pv. ciccaronei]KPX99341.1 hypothetical protein ALO61_100876 [Pseudomonas savastanoi pv. nerii]KPY41590.1 hypothetical protein ALO49_100900 [Pseudomonas savastanoi pv. retacarpa]KPY71904.1 hypothetical protein ALO58_100838 [Pseudomonas savastanoi pv. savastanoi]KUG44208.1 
MNDHPVSAVRWLGAVTPLASQRNRSTVMISLHYSLLRLHQGLDQARIFKYVNGVAISLQMKSTVLT